MDDIFEIENGVIKKLLNNNINDVVIPEGCEKIAKYALLGPFESITFPKSLKELEEHALQCAVLKKVLYAGTVEEWYKNVKKPTGFISWLDNDHMKIISVICSDGRAFVDYYDPGYDAEKETEKFRKEYPEEAALQECLKSYIESDYVYDKKNFYIIVPIGTEYGVELKIPETSVDKYLKLLPDLFDLAKKGLYAEVRQYMAEKKIKDGSKLHLKINSDGELKESLGMAPRYIMLEKNVKYIGEEVFKSKGFASNNKLLTMVDMTENVVTIGKGAFADCPSLTTVFLREGLQDICSEAFDRCKKLKNINIPSSVTYIGSGAFNGCNSLKEIKLPDGLKEILTYAFNACRGLQELVLPPSIESIYSCAFQCCISLKSVVLNEKLTVIHKEAFYGCSNLETIIFKGTKQQWQNIEKGENWLGGRENYPAAPVKVVVCSDGEVVL